MKIAVSDFLEEVKPMRKHQKYTGEADGIFPVAGTPAIPPQKGNARPGGNQSERWTIGF